MHSEVGACPEPRREQDPGPPGHRVSWRAGAMTFAGKRGLRHGRQRSKTAASCEEAARGRGWPDLSCVCFPATV